MIRDDIDECLIKLKPVALEIITGWDLSIPFKAFKEDKNNPHSPWYLQCPNNVLIPFNHHDNDLIDEVRCKWVCKTLNAAIKALKESKP